MKTVYSQKSFSISHWNIKGSHDPIFGCKFQLPELINNITKYDINILSETWGCSHEIHIPNYEMKTIPPNKIKGKKSGRLSGGLTIFYRKYLKSKLDFTKLQTNYMWIKLNNFKSFNPLNGNANSLYICAVYMPPDSSPYFKDDIFYDLNSDINDLINSKIPTLLCGDFNGRTGSLLDFIPHTGGEHTPDLLGSVTTQINTHRRNSDPECNSHGKKLINLCLENNLRIVNGRCLGDSFGRATFVSPVGGKSLIDYTITSDSFFNNINSLVVKPLTHISDHCQVITNINTLMNLDLQNPSSSCNYKWKNLPKAFQWKKESAEAYKAALNNSKIKEKIHYFKTEQFPENSKGVEQANSIITEILCKAANLSLPTKLHRKHKTTKPKKWFNKDCERARISFKKSSNASHRNPSDAALIRESAKKLKEFKKVCKAQQTKFWDDRNEQLQNSNDGNFWNVWKNCNENLSNKTPNVCDGKVWETYYTKLFSNHINKNNDSSKLVNHKKISKENATFLNKLTNCQELKKILKMLKNGKSPGIDRISNEMIKHSFEILKDCFTKLFNLILTVGCVPDIWCKGLITPVHKNGDPSDPDNFRPICVLSCLCKFFTNILNKRLCLVCKAEKLIHISQIGFVEGHRTSDHIFGLKTLINSYTRTRKNKKLYACFVDFRKAYDSVWHDGLFSKLELMNINGNFLEIIRNLYSKSICAIKIQSKATNFFRCERGVRQGCPLSPILFNIFLNDLPYELEKCNPDSLQLPNGELISCLMYADDIVILAKNPEALQKLLDCTNSFCNTWGMTVNPVKTKCITFSSKNRKNNKDFFNIGTSQLENVTEYTYLGLKINAVGSVKNSLGMLNDKANRAKFALNNIAKLKEVPVRTAVRLFDAAVLPILTYGSEIWALNLTLDHDKWDETPIERAHLNFIKHILGVNRSTNNILCRAELGRYPINIHINSKIINFYKHVKSKPNETIVHQAYLLDKQLSQRYIETGTLQQHITNFCHIYPRTLPLSKRLIKKTLKSKYEQIWKDKLSLTSRGIHYSTFKTNISYEVYLDKVRCRKFRRSLTKLRLSDHRLMIEQGRKMKPKIPQNKRTCKLCFSLEAQKIENEEHFLFECPWRKYIGYRQAFTKEILQLVPLYELMNSKQKFIYLVNNEDREICQRFSKFISHMSKEREEALLL